MSLKSEYGGAENYLDFDHITERRPLGLHSKSRLDQVTEGFSCSVFTMRDDRARSRWSQSAIPVEQPTLISMSAEAAHRVD